jgi:hypothetical protein
MVGFPYRPLVTHGMSCRKVAKIGELLSGIVPQLVEMVVTLNFSYFEEKNASNPDVPGSRPLLRILLILRLCPG